MVAKCLQKSGKPTVCTSEVARCIQTVETHIETISSLHFQVKASQFVSLILFFILHTTTNHHANKILTLRLQIIKLPEETQQ